MNEAELRLMSKLFPKSASFMKDVLPVKDKNSSVNVHLQIALRQIMDIVSTRLHAAVTNHTVFNTQINQNIDAWLGHTGYLKKSIGV